MLRGIVLAGLLAAFAHQSVAEAGCLPVAGRQPSLWRASYGVDGDVPRHHIGLSFLGHASFLIKTAEGITAVTDYSGHNRPPRTPTVVTMNNAHSTHYTDHPDPGIRHVLRGWNPRGGMAGHNLQVGDLHIHNVPTNVRDFAGGIRRHGNSIFVFHSADICIAHLGHLHHLLSEVHLTELGKIDVVLTPVDGAFTLGQVDIADVIEQIKPRLVIPMHYFTEYTLARFVEVMRRRYPVATHPGPSILLSRATLPATTEVLILPDL
ncbi:MAG: MBL fold metallo-hydrolase [Alphaproteobacteria bacterium]|nr:MBL fold metallo-hydrolase [Alphaproteobacteria bacterium]